MHPPTLLLTFPCPISAGFWLTFWRVGGSTALGLSISYTLMATLAVAGVIYARHTYPNPDPEELTHTHSAKDQSSIPVEHSHHFVIDNEHRRWPT